MNKMFGGDTSFCLVSQEEKSKGKQRKSNKIDFFNLSVWLSFFLKYKKLMIRIQSGNRFT